ncbi:MAG: septation protein SpoVG family protein [Candidatus Omnitrophota bacterium]
MEITEVKIFMKEGQDKKLKAYATLTFDNMFVVRNVKVIEGTKGLFVAMPSRKLKEPCPKCNFRNVVRSKYCNNCGSALPMPEHKMPSPGAEGAPRESEHKDIAHPITAECRDYIQKKVLEAFEQEKRAPSAPSSHSPVAAPPPHSQSSPAQVPQDHVKSPAMADDEDIEL